jgi:hypothetical protein
MSYHVRNTFWTGLITKGEKRIFVHPMYSVIYRLQQIDSSLPASVTSSTRSASDKKDTTTEDIQPPPESQLQWAKGLLNNANPLLVSLAAVLKRNAETCQAALTREKYASMFSKFTASATLLGTNLTTDFFPRFSDASSKVAGACVKVGYTTCDKIYSIVTR